MHRNGALRLVSPGVLYGVLEGLGVALVQLRPASADVQVEVAVPGLDALALALGLGVPKPVAAVPLLADLAEAVEDAYSVVPRILPPCVYSVPPTVSGLADSHLVGEHQVSSFLDDPAPTGGDQTGLLRPTDDDGKGGQQGHQVAQPHLPGSSQAHSRSAEAHLLDCCTVLLPPLQELLVLFTVIKKCLLSQSHCVDKKHLC